MEAVSEIFNLIAIELFTVDALAYGASIAAVSLRFNFKFKRLCTKLNESVMRWVLAYSFNMAAVSEIFTLVFKPALELATVVYGASIAAVSIRFNFEFKRL